MALRSDSSIASALLTQRLVDADAEPLKAREYWKLLGIVGDPASLLGSSGSEIARSAGLDQEFADRVAARLDVAAAFAFQLDECERTGLRLLTPYDDHFPTPLLDFLGQQSPPLLYVIGDATLMSRPLLGIVGSRDVDEDGARVAQRVAADAVAHGYGVVSGGARGVDRLALNGAAEAGGMVVGVLPGSLQTTARQPEIRSLVTEDRLCLMSPYKPSAGFSVGNAMGRNKLIYALAHSVFVVASERESGGTWAGASEALEAGTSEVIAWLGEGSGSGNPALVERGARGVESVEAVWPLDPADSPSTRDQLAFEM